MAQDTSGFMLRVGVESVISSITSAYIELLCQWLHVRLPPSQNLGSCGLEASADVQSEFQHDKTYLARGPGCRLPAVPRP